MPRKVFFSSYASLQQQKDHSAVKNKNIKTPNKSIMNTVSIVSPKKAEWNEYQTDINQFKLSKEELIKKKQLMLSKNNILTSATKRMSNFSSTPISTKKYNTPVSSRTLRNYHSTLSSASTNATTKLIRRNYIDTTPTYDNENSMMTPTLNKSPAEGTIGPDKWRRINPSENNINFDNEENDNYDEKENDDEEDYEELHKTNFSTHKRDKTSKTPAHKSINICTPSSSKPGTATNTKIKKTHIKTPTSNLFHNAEYKEAEQKSYEEMANDLRGLMSELRHYEQLSGRRSCFDADELELALDLEKNNNSEKGQLNIRNIMRCLTQLVCQSMTYLLQNEVQMNNMKEINDKLVTEIENIKKTVMSVGQPRGIANRKAALTKINNSLFTANEASTATTSIESDSTRLDNEKQDTTMTTPDVVTATSHIISRSIRHPPLQMMINNNKLDTTTMATDGVKDNINMKVTILSDNDTFLSKELTAAVNEYLVMTPSSGVSRSIIPTNTHHIHDTKQTTATVTPTTTHDSSSASAFENMKSNGPTINKKEDVVNKVGYGMSASDWLFAHPAVQAQQEDNDNAADNDNNNDTLPIRRTMNQYNNTSDSYNRQPHDYHTQTLQSHSPSLAQTSSTNNSISTKKVTLWNHQSNNNRSTSDITFKQVPEYNILQQIPSQPTPVIFENTVSSSSSSTIHSSYLSSSSPSPPQPPSSSYRNNNLTNTTVTAAAAAAAASQTSQNKNASNNSSSSADMDMLLKYRKKSLTAAAAVSAGVPVRTPLATLTNQNIGSTTSHHRFNTMRSPSPSKAMIDRAFDAFYDLSAVVTTPVNVKTATVNGGNHSIERSPMNNINNNDNNSSHNNYTNPMSILKTPTGPDYSQIGLPPSSSQTRSTQIQAFSQSGSFQNLPQTGMSGTMNQEYESSSMIIPRELKITPAPYNRYSNIEE